MSDRNLKKTDAARARRQALDELRDRPDPLRTPAADDQSQPRSSDDPRLSLPRYRTIWAELAPLSQAPPTSRVNDLALMHAVMGMPVIRWLCSYLLDVRRGPRDVDRTLALAMGWVMGALPGGTPVIRTAYQRIRSGDLAVAWAFGCPQPVGRSQAHEHIKLLLQGHDPWACQHVALDLHLQLAARHQVVQRSTWYPRMAPLTYLSADGTFVRAHVRQNKPRNRAEERRMYGHRRHKVGFHTHRRRSKHGERDRTGSFQPGAYTRQVEIADLATQLPVVWDTFHPREGERNPVEFLLARHFEMLPTSPVWALSGDKLFDLEHQFLAALELKWGVHPVAPHANTVQAAWQNGEKDGFVRDLDQPYCVHGPMRFAQWDQVWDARRRARHNIPRGAVPPGNATPFARWECAQGLCDQVAYNYVLDNPRLFPVLPHRGDSDLALLRLALQARRNTSESAFSALRRSGAASKSAAKVPAWAEDDEVDWLIGLRNVFRIAARIALETGIYEESLDEGTRLGVIDRTPTSREPTMSDVQQATDARAAGLDPPQAPASWKEQDVS